VKQYNGPPDATIDGPATSKEPVVHIDIDSVVSGLKATREERCMDNLYRAHEDWVFGKVVGIYDPGIANGPRLYQDLPRPYAQETDTSWVLAV